MQRRYLGGPWGSSRGNVVMAVTDSEGAGFLGCQNFEFCFFTSFRSSGLIVDVDCIDCSLFGDCQLLFYDGV